MFPVPVFPLFKLNQYFRTLPNQSNVFSTCNNSTFYAGNQWHDQNFHTECCKAPRSLTSNHDS